MSLIYFYQVKETIVNNRIQFDLAYGDTYDELGTVDIADPAKYKSYFHMVDDGFKIALSKEMKKFAHTVMLDPAPLQDFSYRFVDWETELKIRVYNELVTIEDKSLFSIAGTLTAMDKTMTMGKLQDLLDPTQPTDVGALTNIVDFFKFPIKLETRPAVLTGQGY